MEAKTLVNLGIHLAATIEGPCAIECYELSLVAAREAGDRDCGCTVLGNLCLAWEAEGRPQVAVYTFQQQLNLAKQIGNTREEATALGNLGIVYLDVESGYALEYLEFSACCISGTRRYVNESATLSNMSFAWVQLGDIERAENYAQLSLAAAAQSEDALTTNA